MKRWILLLAVCVLLLTAACAKTQEAGPEPAPAVTAPGERDVKLKLPLGNRNDVAATLSGYTAGFSAKDGGTLRFTVQNGDADVAEGILKDDGSLVILAHGAGESKLTVTAETASGETAEATVSVTVRDARRTLVLIVVGALAVVLLILLGTPVKKEPQPQEETADLKSETETRKE